MRNDDKKKDRAVKQEYDYLGKSASAMDCTGLIPSLPEDEAEREAYEELYPYQPKAITRPEDK